MYKFILLLFSIFSQGIGAAQTYQIDVNNCPETLHVYQGDTLHFINPASSLHTQGVRSALFSSAPLLKGDSYDYTFAVGTFLAAPVTLPVYCNLFPYNLPVADSQPLLVTISNNPVAVYPKQHLTAVDNPLSVSIYIAAVGNPRDNAPQVLPTLKRIILLVDKTKFYDGDIKEFTSKTFNLEVSKRAIVSGCDFYDVQSECTPGHEGYIVYTFNIPANTFDVGKHVIKAQVTLATVNGEATYEDKGEYTIYYGYKLIPDV